MSNKQENSAVTDDAVNVNNDHESGADPESEIDNEEIIDGEIISEEKDDTNPYIEKELQDEQSKIKERLANSAVDTSDAKPRFIGYTAIIIVFGFLFIWSFTAPLDSAAYAPGKVAVEGSTKTIQHLEGGIVKAIHVKEGQLVKKGDLLVVLDDTQLKAQLEIIETQYIAALGLAARLQAEQNKDEQINFDTYLLDKTDNAAVKKVMHLEDKIFTSRKTAREGEINVLKQRIEQLKEQKIGLQAQQISSKKQIKLFNGEIIEFRDLLKKGFTDKIRMREMQRRVIELEGSIAQYNSEVAATQIRIGETELQIIQIENNHQQEVAELLSTTLVNVNDLKEKRLATADKVDRAQITAQDSGIVLGMSIHTIGGVILAGTPILEIVPQGNTLIIEAQVSPVDIDKVQAGLVSEVRFSSFKSASTPIVTGIVLTVSADSLVDEATGMPYFLARIRVTPESYEELGDLKLLPGMPADAIIKTGERTVFEYLVQPASNAMARSFLED